MRLLQSQQSQNDVAAVSQPVGRSSGLSCYEQAISVSDADASAGERITCAGGRCDAGGGGY